MPMPPRADSELRDRRDLLLQRIYHEDNLFVQRTYSFLTLNAFLAAALGVVSTRIQSISYAIACLGLLLAILQIAVGRRLEVTSNFFRQYLWLVERELGEGLDNPLFMFYEHGEADTEFGKIAGTGRDEAMYKMLPWRVLLIRSMNKVMGVVLPTLVTAFWLSVLMLLLANDGNYWAMIPVAAITVPPILAVALREPRQPEASS